MKRIKRERERKTLNSKLFNKFQKLLYNSQLLYLLLKFSVVYWTHMQ